MKVSKHISIDNDLLRDFLAKQPPGFNFSGWVATQIRKSLWVEDDEGADDQDD